MSHSHFPARHLLGQIESDRSKRSKPDIRPQWVTAFITSAAELFEPLAEVGRVGYECRLDENGWAVSMYLGAVEFVGGKEDGQYWASDFRFDLQPLLARFTRILRLTWTVTTATDGSGSAEALAGIEPAREPRSYLSIDGLLGTNRLRLSVESTAPLCAGPALRRLPDGRIEAV